MITLTQRFNSFVLILFALICANLMFVRTVQATEAASKPTAVIKRTPEAAFSDGLNCLKFSDLPCAQLALVNIPSQTANAKVLSGGIAVLQADYDLAFRLLLPLQSNSQADTSLAPAARASLHASLSLAYEKLPDMQHAIEQKSLEEQVLLSSNASVESIQQTQTKMWGLLTSLNKDQLVEVRGESADANMQGWVDLALANLASFNTTAIVDWQKAYPDHSAQPLSNTIVASLVATSPIDLNNQTSHHLTGRVALLLPFDVDGFKTLAMTIQSGFSASAAIDNNSVEIKPYSTFVQKGDFAQVYALAISEGANYVLGAGEEDKLLTQPLSVPTLMLYGPFDTPIASKNIDTKNLYPFSLSLDDEAAQLAKIAHEFGMQNGLVVIDDTTLSSSMTKALNTAWQTINGQTLKQISIHSDFNLLDLKAQVFAQQADMILIAGDSTFAKKIRPYLDIATPTFGFSNIYDGVPNAQPSSQLNAIHFTDMPWMLNPASFMAYQTAIKETPQNDQQRWFAMGADAYQILKAISQKETIPTHFKGLTGTIHINEQGVITREPSLGSFTSNGVVLEK